MRKKLLFLIWISIICAHKTFAQIDPHFSQYYAYPLWLNPALTGVIDGDLRLNANYKSQWASVGNGYKTGGFSADYKPSNQVGIGFNVINQAAGTAGFNYFAAYGSFGYGVELSSEYEWLNFGLQIGVINRSVDPGKFQTDSQYDPTGGYNPNLPINENLIASNSSVFDAGAGIFYHNDDPDQVVNIFAGISAAHLSRPKDPFAMGGTDYKLPIRLNFHGGVRISASDRLAVIPHAIYIRQNKSEIKALGTTAEFTFDNDNVFVIGGMYRLDDAAIANIGYKVSSLTIGASYDVNTSNFNVATGGRGGIELSISYVFRKGIFGPSPACPRF